MRDIKYDTVLRKCRENDAAEMYVANTIWPTDEGPVSGKAVTAALATKQPLITPEHKLSAEFIEGVLDPANIPELPYISVNGGTVNGTLLSVGGGYEKRITTIPDEILEYALEPGKVYRHSPSAASTYTLPDIADATSTKDIAVSVAFSASALSCAFVDSQGVTIPMLRTPDISAGQTWEFECTYIAGGWRIMPVSMEVEE